MFIITTAVGGLLRHVYAVLVCIALWLQEPASPPPPFQIPAANEHLSHIPGHGAGHAP